MFIFLGLGIFFAWIFVMVTLPFEEAARRRRIERERMEWLRSHGYIRKG